MLRAIRFRLAVALLISLWAASAAAQEAHVGTLPDTESSKAASAAANEAAEEENPGVPVELDGRPLFLVHAPIAGYSAEERAARIQERVLTFARNRTVAVDSIRTEDHDAFTQVLAGSAILVFVTDADAKAAGRKRQALAAEEAEILRQAVTRYRSEHTWQNLLYGSLYALLATLVLLVALYLLRRVSRVVRAMVERWVQAGATQLEKKARLRVQTGSLFSPVLMVGGLFRWVLILALLQFYLTFVLAQFPATRQTSLMVSRWMFAQLARVATSVVDYLPNLFLVVVILIITYYVIHLNRYIFGQVRDGRLAIKGFYADWADPTAKLIRFAILVLAAVVVFPYLPGSGSPAFKGISIFVGVLLSLGSSSAVANAVAGTILIYMRSFREGDFVRIGDNVGEVVERSMLVTRIRTLKDEIVTIPNGTVMGTSVINYSSLATGTGVIFHTKVSIGYDAPWRTVHKLLIDAALATSYIQKEPAPFVLQSSLDDFYISYELNAYTNTPRKMLDIYSELHQNIQDKFNEAGVEICSPHFASLRDGNRIAIPNQYVPADYQARSFRVVDADKEGRAKSDD